MAKTITIEVTDEEEEAVAKAVQPYRKEISDNPALLSLLYDVDLLPEQINRYVNVNRMVAICELFKMVPPKPGADIK